MSPKTAEQNGMEREPASKMPFRQRQRLLGGYITAAQLFGTHMDPSLTPRLLGQTQYHRLMRCAGSGTQAPRATIIFGSKIACITLHPFIAPGKVEGAVSHVLVYHGPLLSHLFGGCAIYFDYGVTLLIQHLTSREPHLPTKLLQQVPDV